MSQHKHAEKIGRQNSFYETLLKAQSDLGEGLVVVERERFVYCNGAFCEITGYDVAELANLPNVLDLAVPEERSGLEERLARRLRGDAVVDHYETALRHADGHRVDLEIAVRLLPRDDQSPQLVVIVRDVTGRKRAEKKSESTMNALLALHESGRVLNSSLDVTEIGVRLLEVARRVSSLDAASLYLMSQDGKLGALSVFGPVDLRQSAGVQGRRRAALRSKEPQKFRTTRSEGKSPPLVGLCIPLQIQDRVIGVLEGFCVGENINERMIDTLESMAYQATSALENARLYKELADREAQLENLVGKLFRAQEQERRRVAHEIHDGLTQVAIGTHQSLQAFADEYPPTAATGRARLNRALQLARQTVREARRVITDLRPTTLDDFGLVAALRLKVESLRADGWEIDYEETLGDERLPPDIETVLFRVTQEALTNVRKHALTSRACVNLTRQDTKVCLEVSDAGCGFDQGEALMRTGQVEHVGLSTMLERIALLGGNCQINSRLGVGTSVVAEVPLPEDEKAGA